MTTHNVPAMLEDMAQQLKQRCAKQVPLMIGIHTGGVWVAEQLHKMLELPQPLGSLNISFYRDDFTQIGMHPQVNPSHIPYSVENQSIILVDDVLYTGRTIRAAINEIFDYGRPAAIHLAVLVDRGGRELPIQADVVGKQMQPGPGEQIKLSGPAPLELSTV
ncbi:MAG TPA: bifunctional pyr operon transcriptional regulator/uracil phosphoribosyltransferase PyrR [Gammaproteobacteria bacterium]|nr:bifunctional pyr operon transcriptional regulator/uracil phosphoribosyltransferase PyrR [Gammaproteobacteria bacterium]